MWSIGGTESGGKSDVCQKESHHDRHGRRRKPTVRERKAKAAWLWRIRKLMKTYRDCLAIGVDYHF